jgi:hypothetical protein
MRPESCLVVASCAREIRTTRMSIGDNRSVRVSAVRNISITGRTRDALRLCLEATRLGSLSIRGSFEYSDRRFIDVFNRPRRIRRILTSGSRSRSGWQLGRPLFLRNVTLRNPARAAGRILISLISFISAILYLPGEFVTTRRPRSGIIKAHQEVTPAASARRVLVEIAA